MNQSQNIVTLWDTIFFGLVKVDWNWVAALHGQQICIPQRPGYTRSLPSGSRNWPRHPVIVKNKNKVTTRVFGPCVFRLFSALIDLSLTFEPINQSFQFYRRAYTFTQKQKKPYVGLHSLRHPIKLRQPTHTFSFLPFSHCRHKQMKDFINESSPHASFPVHNCSEFKKCVQVPFRCGLVVL